MGRIGIVAGMHVAALYLIAASLGIAPPLKLPPPITTFIPEKVVPIDPPPRVDPVIEQPRVILVAPDLPVPDADPAPSNSITGEVRPIHQIPTEQPGTAVPRPEIVGPQIDPRRPLSRPQYPPEIIRMNGEGSVVVEIYVMENGRVGDARIVRSSGFEALDRATINEAKRNWRLKPATRDGVPMAQWHKLSVAFRLEDR